MKEFTCNTVAGGRSVMEAFPDFKSRLTERSEGARRAEREQHSGPGPMFWLDSGTQPEDVAQFIVTTIAGMDILRKMVPENDIDLARNAVLITTVQFGIWLGETGRATLVPPKDEAP